MTDGWWTALILDDGSVHIHWPSMFDARVLPGGTSVEYVPADGVNAEALASLLLGAVVSYVLLERGLEPLHATVLERNGRSFGFLGDSGYGKSTLAAWLISEGGCRLVTDDLLVVRDPGSPRSEPGLPRLKLEPDAAKQFLGRSGPSIAPGTGKVLVPVGEQARATGAVPLDALFLLPSPVCRSEAAAIESRPCSKGESFLAVTRNTFNSVVVGRERLAGQFGFAESLAQSVRVVALCFPDGFELLPKIGELVMSRAANR